MQTRYLNPDNLSPDAKGYLNTNLILAYQVQTRYLNPDNLSLDADGYFTLFLFLRIRCRHDTWTRTICPWTPMDTSPYSCSCVSGADTILEPGQSVPGRGWVLHQPRGAAAGPLCLPALRWWNMTYFTVFRIRIRIGSGFNQVTGSGSGSRRAKMTHKSRKKFRNFMFWSAGCSLEGWRLLL